MTKDELNRKLRSNQWVEGNNWDWYKNGVKIYVREHDIDIVSKDGDRNIDIKDLSYGEFMDAISKWKNGIIDKVIDALKESEWTLEDKSTITKYEIAVCFFESCIAVSNNLITYSCSYSDVYFTEDEVHLGDLTIDRRE